MGFSREWIIIAAASLALGYGLGSLYPALGQPAIPVGQSSIEPVFSPGADGPVLAFVSSAQETLDVELYQFSYPPLKEALVAAAGRGVRVRLLLEPRVESNLQTAAFLASKGVAVRWASTSYTNTHSKTAVADGKRVLVGSINWSGNAMKTNRESGVVVGDPSVAQEFERVFEEDWADGTPAVAG